MLQWRAIGCLASCLVLAAFGMKKLVQLRIVTICGNLVFIAYGLGLALTPVWLLHAVLIPLNGWRVWQALRSARDSRETAAAPGHKAANNQGTLPEKATARQMAA